MPSSLGEQWDVGCQGSFGALVLPAGRTHAQAAAPVCNYFPFRAGKGPAGFLSIIHSRLWSCMENVDLVVFPSLVLGLCIEQE